MEHQEPADGATADEVAAYIWAAVNEMYAAFRASDRERIDRFIHEDATLWDSEEPALVMGLSGLNDVRARRSDDAAASVADIVADDPVITVWNDFAVCRHVFTVRPTDPGRPVERIRNTGVWRRIDGRWLIVHNHEDKLAA